MNFIPYGRQTIDNSDIQSIVNVLVESKYLTTGPKVDEFEKKICEYTGMKYAIAVSNGTAALHCAAYAAGIGEGDEVIVPTMSFVASSNCILYCGGKPIFCDIDPDTLNIDYTKIENLITDKTKAIMAVDFAGQLCNYQRIIEIAKKYNLLIIQDASHSVGVTQYNLDYCADLITLSFHPVKNITTGEGGMILTNDENMANRMRQFRSHGIDNDYKSRYLHYYDMKELGYNYRLTDLQCALGISQLKRIDQFMERRKEIADIYTRNILDGDLKKYIQPLKIEYECAFHIYIIKLAESIDRDEIYKKLLEKNIGVNVHYKPIHLHSYYINNQNTFIGQYPVAEDVYKQILTLPIYPILKDGDVYYVINTLKEILLYHPH